jgi:hypothetical protein
LRVRLAVLAAVAVALAAAPASASTLTGKVSGAKRFTTVRAVDARTLVITDVAKVRSRRYRLKVPAGSYWLFAATPGVDRSAGKVAIRKGKKKQVPVSLRRRKRPRALAAFVNVKYPAVWVRHFSVSDVSEYGQLRKGIADMLISDLADPLERACGGKIVEREKLAFLIREQAISNPGQPPSTARWIAHNREIGGSWTVAGGTATLMVNVTNVVSGATRSVTRTGDADRFFELVPSVVQEVVRLLCDKPPRYYAGPASGSIVAANGSSSETLSWSGNVRLKSTGDLSDGDPPGEYARYQPESGSFHVILDGVNAECTYHATADAAIVPPPLGGQDSFVQQGVDAPFYRLDAQFPEDTPPMLVTVTGPAYCDGGSTYPYGLAGRVIMTTLTNALRSSSSTLTGETSRVLGNVTFKWAWSLSAQAG